MKTVLLTDDNEDIVELVKLVLAKSGYRVETAPDGNAAVSRCMQDPPDLVIMDLNMPGMNGFDATRRLREQGYTRPIVILTASESDADRKRAKECGADAYILKTLNMDDVERVLDRYLVDIGGLH